MSAYADELSWTPDYSIRFGMSSLPDIKTGYHVIPAEAGISLLPAVVKAGRFQLSLE